MALRGPEPGETPVGAGWLSPSPPFPAYYNKGFGVTNNWREYSEGGFVVTSVFAGGEYADVALGLPGQQGLVVVQVFQIDQARLNGGLTYNELFHTPTASGEVTITGAQGDRLILQSTGGTTFYFDVPTRQFVPSLAATVTAPVPTPGPESPLPTGTPVP